MTTHNKVRVVTLAEYRLFQFARIGFEAALLARRLPPAAPAPPPSPPKGPIEGRPAAAAALELSDATISRMLRALPAPLRRGQQPRWPSYEALIAWRDAARDAQGKPPAKPKAPKARTTTKTPPETRSGSLLSRAKALPR